MASQKEKLEQKFSEEYNKLNEQQRLAVDTIEGPVMVLAGPGTGKTQVLACRVGKILLEGVANPENILCITFTDAGAVAMRQRLLEFIGPTAYKVSIYTFHSFCNSVIRENIALFNKKELEAVSDLERVQIIKELIDGFENDNPLKRFKGDVYYDLGNLTSLFSAIKKEAWETNWLLGKIDDYVAGILPETDGFYNKREKKKGIHVLTQKGKDEMERMEKLKAAVKTFPVYQKALDERHRYDFDDMINWVIDLFEKNKEVLLRYQEQMQYFLVDEYQDSSGSQNRIVELLISYWKDEKPNLFVVGDDDQSIYRFQGANLKNLMTLAAKFEKDLKKIVLDKNYRSVQPILDAAKLLIENNQQRLVNQYNDLTKDLIAAGEELKNLDIKPEIRCYENEFSENVHVALSIKQMVDSGTRPGDIAVIYKEHRFGDELIRFLQLQNIPFFAKRSVNLLEDLFINKILNIIRYVIAELDTEYSGEPLLFEILHYDFFTIHPHRIAAICNEVADNKYKENSIKNIRAYLLDLSKKENGTLFSQNEDTEKLVRVSALLENLQKEIYNRPVAHWFEYLVNEGGILAYIMNHTEKLWLMEMLTCLFDYIKDEMHRQPEMTLKQLMHQIDLMKENDLRLELVQTTGSETGVNLMTCHGSKGLEFENVFLINARNDIWEGKRKNNKGFRLPPNVFELDSDAEITEELRRLFYVSVTRAKKHLFISYPKMKNEGSLLEPSQFVEEIRQPMSLVLNNILLDENDKFRFSALRFGVIQKPVLEQMEKEYTDRLLQNFSMNVTALNNFLDCPLRFYYNTLVKIPSAKSEAAAFGTAVHAALADFTNKMMENRKIYPGKEFLLSRFCYHLNKEREIFTKESLRRFLDGGQDILSNYFNNYYDPAPKNEFILTEYPLTKVVLDNIPLKGFTDKIQFWGKEIAITDYKTGSFEKAKRRGEFLRPGEKAEFPNGGNYWRQAVFYKILVDNLPGKNWKVLYAQFDFVEPVNDDKFIIEKIPITAVDENHVKQQIREVWERIRLHDFYTGCGEPDCEWCNFAKNNKIYIRLEEEEPAEL